MEAVAGSAASTKPRGTIPGFMVFKNKEIKEEAAI